jgi:uncharacterized protein (TIGR03790 family)
MRPSLLLTLAALVLLPSAAARAELKPEEIAVLAMAESREGRALAGHYVRARGMPASQICLLPGKPAASIGRMDFEESILPAVRKWLAEDGREERIRCLVTCWDMPLRVGKVDVASHETAMRIEFLRRARAQLLERANALLAQLDAVAAAGDAPAQPTKRPELKPNIRLEDLAGKIDAALKAANARGQKLASDAEKREAGQAVEQALVAATGIAGLLRFAGPALEAHRLDAARAEQVGVLKGRLAGLSEGARAVSQLPESVARDTQALSLVGRVGGVLGAVRWIDEQQELLTKNETYASIDSELSMLHWPEYSLFRWQVNTLNYRIDRAEAQFPRTLMVARLAAPTLARAKDLVDQAIATERAGLKGKVYIDARGIAFDPAKGKPGSYGQYDQSLRDLAQRLRMHTKLDVVLDNEAALFQPGQCPDAALYCGWYSLAKYVDAFDWAPGAVGYHIASSEATTLRRPGAQVWCNAMLEDGITATLGPVHEPYLAAFPLPDDFFPLLLTGRYTLIETYYRTKPFNSWAMVLVGDPLYNPFTKDPPLSEKNLPERMRSGAAEPLPLPGEGA